MSRTPEENEKIVQDGLKDKIRRTARFVPFADDAVAAYYCATDRSTPKKVKFAIMGALAYFVMPFDAVPDFIALLGYGDDAAVFWATWRLIRAHVTDAHRDAARTFIQGSGADKIDDEP